ncbi:MULTISPECIES: UDP-N-acetylglucosamine 1-carboxyvinyltransferase [unclassified Granulicatella]|uniref:UDP-N-acetylglucosamine 1-carboxyvinyltransferase n=1 Tax=unclassified Granulicatella TaxID=2630493 RepID=UPI0010730402|nr:MULTISPECIES: UDP-N-acetylglucosamine 1-carboxyvinyltransferase [unclassified Granulicatella]MBF0780376.1 UDP-N-acetylglucosamine 1-carboxyvinyltransferase [Granulicatella sp. 19428wC4_WM01]TFU95464.1 UDP-N-acetylglucosamine 1-carboxyvinyltransferase [Granulicatella sp. WM01]
MERIIVRGGKKLTGKVKVEGAKNAVLPILAASILAESGKTNLANVPILSDVYLMNDVLKSLHVDLKFDETTNTMEIDATGDISTTAPFEYVSKMRASIVVMGPLLARKGFARVSMPGGCAIGSRPIDLHLKGFEALGATITTSAGFIEARADKLIGSHIYLDFPSVGATQNIMMAATLAEGTTVLENVAREPEIVDLANILNKMGARISGAGTDTIRIKGVNSLVGASHYVIPDRIETGTFMIAAAITQGDIFIEDAISDHNKPLMSKLHEMGVRFEDTDTGIRVIAPEHLKGTDAKTMPHPGFPTDMQAQMTIAQLLSDRDTMMTETVFENRFMHFEELRRMNAQFHIEGSTVFMRPSLCLQGAEVAATDLRAAAALVLAGLRADGFTQVVELKYLDRGYFKFHEKLANLGADIVRVPNRLSDEDMQQLFV